MNGVLVRFLWGFFIKKYNGAAMMMRLFPLAPFLLFAMLVHSSDTALCAAIVPNETMVTGVVCEYAVVSGRLLGIEPDDPVYRLTLYIESAEDVAGMPNLLKGMEGSELSLHMKQYVPPEVFAKKVRGRASFRGDEGGGRWWGLEITVLNL